MQTLFSFFLLFQLTEVAISAYFSFRIARMKVTDTFTWSLLSLAFCITFCRLCETYYYSGAIFAFLNTFNPSHVFVDQIIGTTASTLVSAGVTRIYFTIRNKFRGIVPPNEL